MPPNVCNQHFRIAGASLFIAAKYEEIYPPALKEFQNRMRIHVNDLLDAEGAILAAIGFTCTAPTVLSFVECYSLSAPLSDDERHRVNFMLQIAMHDVRLWAQLPSKLSAAAILVVLKLRNISLQTVWSDDLFHLSGYRQEMLENIGNQLYGLLHFVCAHTDSAVFQKFCNPSLNRVAL